MFERDGTPRDGSIPIVGVGTGPGMILHPKLKHNWRIRFPTLETSDSLASQVVAVSPIELSDESTKDIIIDVEDDIASAAMRLVHRVFKEQVAFDAYIDLLDGNERVLETRGFFNCVINHILIDRLQYAPTKEQKWINFCIPEIADVRDGFQNTFPELELVANILNGLKIELPVKSRTTGQLIHQVMFKYDHVTFDYPVHG